MVGELFGGSVFLAKLLMNEAISQRLFIISYCISYLNLGGESANKAQVTSDIMCSDAVLAFSGRK